VGGGVQYTSLDVDASPTGNVILAMQGSTVLALQCSTNTPSTGSLGLWVREIPSTRVQEVVPQTGAAWSVAVPAVAVVATVTSVADTASSAQLLGLLATRKGYKLFNDSTEVAYVKEGTTATTSDYSYQIQPLGFYESVGLGCYTGRIDCIWANNASGAMKITELV
jgi:hypothetical protein